MSNQNLNIMDQPCKNIVILMSYPANAQGVEIIVSWALAGSFLKS